MRSGVIFGLVLVAVSGGLLLWNVLSGRHSARREQDESIRRYEQALMKRRLRTSAAVGLVGLALIGGAWIAAPLSAALYWLGILLAVLWITCVALADMVSARAFYQRMHAQQLAKNAALRTQIEQFRRRQGNGRKDA